jgi:hypothetical protein
MNIIRALGYVFFPPAAMLLVARAPHWLLAQEPGNRIAGPSRLMLYVWYGIR